MVVVISTSKNTAETYESLENFFKEMISQDKYITSVDTESGKVFFGEEEVILVETTEEVQKGTVASLMIEVDRIKSEMKKSYQELSLFGVDKKIVDKIKSSFAFLDKSTPTTKTSTKTPKTPAEEADSTEK